MVTEMNIRARLGRSLRLAEFKSEAGDSSLNSLPKRVAISLSLLLLGNACAALRIDSERVENARLILSYDTNRDGIVTRDELENELRREFMLAKTNRSSLSFDAYVAKARSAFQMLDRNRDGKLTSDELRL